MSLVTEAPVDATATGTASTGSPDIFLRLIGEVIDSDGCRWTRYVGTRGTGEDVGLIHVGSDGLAGNPTGTVTPA